MSEPATRPLVCGHCHEMFERPKMTGRPPSYCSIACRKAAYRGRSQPARVSSAAHDADVLRIADAVHNRANNALHLGKRPLRVRPLDLVAEIQRMERDLNDFKAVAVRQAHENGAHWSEIGKVLCMEAGHARTRFSSEKVLEVLSRRAARGTGVLAKGAGTAPAPPSGRADWPAEDDAPPGDGSLPGDPGYQLSTALSHLQRSRGLTGRSIAHELCISPSLLSRILLGNRTPKWRVVKGFAELCGVDPADLRPLYEKARGLRVVGPPSPETYTRAARGLQTTLRGMWLAAGSPDTTSLCRDGRFTPQEINGALESEQPAVHLANWSFVARLAAALRGNPDDLRGLWEQMDAARALAPGTPNKKAALKPTVSGTAARRTPKPAPTERAKLAWPVAAPRQAATGRTDAAVQAARARPGGGRPGPGRWDWVLRTVDVLHTVAESPSPRTSDALGRAAGLLPDSVRELLDWLQAVGLTTPLDDGTHTTGPLLAALHTGLDVPAWVLAQLSLETQAAVYFGEYVDGEVGATRSWHGPDTPPVHEYVPFGDTAHANALGKAFLAQLDSDRRKDHLARHRPIELTASTITDPHRLEVSLTTTGARGVYYDLKEYSDTEKCAAVPLNLPGRTSSIAISLPPAAHPRIGDASKLLRGHSLGLMLALALTVQTLTPPGP